MSLLSVCNDTCDIIGIERQIAIAAGTGGDARQLYSLAKRELSELARRTSWQALIKDCAWFATATATQPDGMQDDFLFYVNETLFNYTLDHEVWGPVSPREWQLMQANGVAGATIESFRIRGNVLFLNPVPTAGHTYSYEYVTKYLVLSAPPEYTERETFLYDTDVAKLDEELIKLGVVWRWKSLKGLDYAEDFRTYENQVANSIARDGGKRTISMDPGRPPGIPAIGIPAGNWTP